MLLDKLKQNIDRHYAKYRQTRFARFIAQFAAPLMLFIIAVICLQVYQTHNIKRAQQQVYETLTDSAKAQVNALSICLDGQFEVLDTYSSTLDGGNLGTTENQLFGMGKIVQATNFSRLMLIDGEGNALTSQGLRTNVANESFYRAVMAGQRIVVNSDGDSVDNVPHFILAVPIFFEGRITGALGGTFSEQAFRELIVSEAFGRSSDSLICSSVGHVILKGNSIAEFPQSNLFTMLKTTDIDSDTLSDCRGDFAVGRSGIASFSAGGAGLHAVYLPIGINNWMLINVVAGEMIEQTVAATLRSGTLLTAIIISVAILLTLYILVSNRRQQLRIEEERRHLRLSDERFRIALAETSVNIWEYDFATHSATAAEKSKTDALFELLLEPPESLVESDLIHPESIADYLGMYERLFAGEPHAEGVFRIREAKTAPWRYISIRYTSLSDRNGEPYRAIGMSEDVTERQQAKLAYERELTMQQTMEPDMFITALFDVTANKVVRKWFADEREAVSLYDDRMETFTQYAAARIVTDTDKPKDWELTISKSLLQQRFAAGKTEMIYEYLRRMPDGSERYIEDESHLLLDPETGHLMMFSCLRDIDTEYRQRAALLAAADSDSMTGLLNHEAALRRIERELPELQEGAMHAMFIIDIDDFKLVNDTLGHQTGDDAIKHVASLIRGAFRESDIIGRIGGDEFIALMKNVGSQKAVRNKAQELIETMQFTCRHGDLSLSLSASIGVCIAATAAVSLDELYRSADTALYESKSGGKNRYTLHNGQSKESGRPQNIGGVSSTVQLHTLLENMEGGVVMAEVGEEVRILYASPSMYRMMGAVRDAAGSRDATILTRVDPDDLPALKASVFAGVRAGRQFEHTFRARKLDGAGSWWHLNGANLPKQADDVNRIICVVTDITELKRSEESLRIAQSVAAAARGSGNALHAALERLVDVEYEYIALLDTETTVLSLLSVSAHNVSAIPENGMRYATLCANTCDTLVAENEREDSRISFRLSVVLDALADTPLYARTYAVRDEKNMHCRKKWQFTYLDSSKRTLVLTRSDVSDTFLAELDPLTCIFNRYKLSEAIRTQLDTHPDTIFALVRIDIDNFKVFNDIYGVAAGDRLLQSAADYLRSLYVKNPMLLYGRIEADHFMCCVPADMLDWMPRAAEIATWLAAHNPPFTYTPRIGIYRIDEPNINVALMSDRAYLALKTIKGKYGRQVAYYSENMRNRLLKEQEIVGRMHNALENQQFDVYLQPQFDYTTGEMTGAEALVRWRHPDRGVLTPGEFISVFEQNGFITQLDCYVWERVCKLLAKWRDAGDPILPLSVNVSRHDIYNHSVLTILEDLLQKYRIPPTWLRLEITESAYSENPEQLISVVNKLRAIGFAVEMDDFGSGYSSLHMLNNVSVDMLKLDMSFLPEMHVNGGANSVLNSIVRMMHWLQLPLIAEGIETAEQAEYMKSIGCVRMQGYYFGRPMPIEVFERIKAEARIASFERRKQIDAEREQASRRAAAKAAELFRSAEHAALIVEYCDGNVEVLRINDRFYEESGLQHKLLTSWTLHMQDLLNADSRMRFIAAMETAVDTGTPAQCYIESTVDAIHAGVPVRCEIHLLQKLAERSILFVSMVHIDQTL